MLSPGEGALTVTRVGARSVIAGAHATSPLRLLTPKNHGDAAWVYLVNFGGGLVDGDCVRLRADVGPGATLMLTTQSQSKVYRSPRGCTQALDARIYPGGMLASVPDPVVCFAGARFEQTTRVVLEDGASAVLAESFTAGRAASGERWAFERYCARTSVERSGRAVLLDAVLLDASHSEIAAGMHGYGAFGTFVAFGPRAMSVRSTLLGARERGPTRIVSASALGDDGAVARVAARDTEVLTRTARELLGALPGLLGDDPFARKF